MNDRELIQATADELIALARERGFDLASLFQGELFWAIDCSRHFSLMKGDEGILYYLQGKVVDLPDSEKLLRSETFNGCYSENGIVEDMEQALQLLQAWLLDLREVDDLPKRISGRLGKIG